MSDVRPIEAEAVIPHPPATVFEFLADLRNHWRLEPSFLDLEELHGNREAPSGGRVRIRGPFGLSRVARTRVLEAVPPDGAPGWLRGRADVGSKTVGSVAWHLDGASGGTRVSLTARVESASLGDRLLLALGGRRWLEALFGRAVGELGRVLTAEPRPAGRPR